eukprot:399816-Alexandrium_andersonii.AAC.1
MCIRDSRRGGRRGARVHGPLLVDHVAPERECQEDEPRSRQRPGEDEGRLRGDVEVGHGVAEGHHR